MEKIIRHIVSLLLLWCYSQSVNSQDTVIINEVMAANVDQIVSPAWNFDGWVELYNPTEASVKIGGLYISDDSENLKKWQLPIILGTIPAHGYRLLWLGSHELYSENVPFALDQDGGSLFLSDKDGNLLASASYPQAIERASWARTTDGGEIWAFTTSPTPLSDNATADYGSRWLMAPEITPGSRFFDNKLHLHLVIPEGCRMYYTTDGTVPTPDNGRRITTKYLIIEDTSILRFRLYQDGALASPVVTRSYVKRDAAYSLPALHVVSDPRFLYDDSLGIYVRGVNGKPGIGQFTKANWNMEWDRPVNMSYVDTDGSMLENKDVDMRIAGGWSRGAARKSFKLKGRKEYGGDCNYTYPFFSAKPFLRNRTLLLRNGGNDSQYRLKDPALGTMIQLSGIDLDVQSYQPVHHFINGHYMGLINMREPSNKHFVYANHGWDDDEIDMFEINCDSAYIQQCGSREGFERAYALSADAADSNTYREIRQWIDIDEFINYMAMSLYLGRGDWPHNNMKGYRKTDGGRLRLVAFDIDAAYEQSNPFKYLESEQYHKFNVLFNGKPQITAEIEVVTIFLNLMKNADFRKQFITTFSLMGGSVFNYTRCCDIVDSLFVRIEPALALEGISAISMAAKLKDGLQSRESHMASVINSWPLANLTGQAAKEVSLQTDGTPGAHITINGIDIPYASFEGHLFAPAIIHAIAPSGYRFKGWRHGFDRWDIAIPRSATWKYDTSPEADEQWKAFGYDDSSWPAALLPVAGNAHRLRLKTMINYRPTADDEYVLTIHTGTSFTLYLNGQERYRHQQQQDVPQTITVTLSGSVFKLGKNVFAVELDTTSRQSLWTAKMEHHKVSSDDTFYSYREQLHIETMKAYELTAVFERLDHQARKEAGLTPVCINEISAANNIFVNEYINRSDWLELYNQTDEPIDAAGLYLSDDPEDPYRWQIAADSALTIIAPHSHLVVWCDRSASGCQLHAPFKLSANGGTLVLTAADGSWSDRIDYPAHDGQHTIGRYPDGHRLVYMFDRPTIAAANTINSYSFYVSTAQATDFSDIGAIDASAPPVSLSYSHQRLTLSGPNAGDAIIIVTSIDGRRQQVPVITVRDDFCYADLPMLPAGIYIAQAQTTRGRAQTAVLKFIK